MTDIMYEGFFLMLKHIWMVPLGVLVGMIVGAVPGLTSSNSLAIMLPIIFLMEPAQGLVFMVSVNAGAQMGNSFPAILLNIPGTASSAITALEGHPMRLRGEANRALGICVMASGFGALIGGVVALLATPPLAKVALKFSPVELCIVILFGIAIIGQMSSAGVSRGLMLGAFGLLLATIGADPMWGQFRSTFGFIYLIDGLPLVPALVGLLAFSEVLKMMENKFDKQGFQTKEDVGVMGIIGGFMDVIKRPVEWIRSSIIGVIIGIVPGAGGSVAAFVAYQQAMSLAKSKVKGMFGKGSPEGLIAADAANNGMVGGSIIPLLTLGIPGSTSCAVLMVVMGYHGLYLGPRLFTVNGDVAYAVLWSLFVGAFCIVIIGTLLAYVAGKVVFIDQNILIPIIAVFCVIGGFASRQIIFDVGIMLGFGVLGYIMKKYNYPPIALLLGLILGSLFEANFFRGLAMGHGSISIFFNRPLAIFLWILFIATVIVPVAIKKYYSRKEVSD